MTRALVIATVLLSAICVEAQSRPPVRFRDIGKQSGIITVPHSSPDKRYLVEEMGGGVALFDCDNDGRLDILATTDSTIDQYLNGGDPMVTLYRQDKDLHFTDITESGGLNVRGWGMGVAAADFNNDGLIDIYVTGYGHNVLYQNMGGCKFKDVTQRAGVSGGGFSVGAAWADYDHDGYLDLFVSRYVQTDLRKLPKPGTEAFTYKGLSIEVPAGQGETSFLFHNRGDGTFEELSQKAGVNNADRRRGMGVIWSDYDEDGWVDLFVANDMGANYLFHNRHNGTFEDVGMVSGTAVDSSGQEMGNMAGDFGDFDRDGKLDLLVSRFGNQPLSLYQNEGAKGFWDVTWKAGIGRLSYAPVKWGTAFGDFDNDGWPDIFLANGNIVPEVDEIPGEARYREPIQLFRNKANKTFEEIADPAGLNDGPLQSRRGIGFGDLNNDGNVDVVVYNVGGPPSVFLNETRNSNHRVLLRLVAARNQTIVGARVIVRTAQMSQIAEVTAGSGYLSCSDQRLHFGLGTESVIQNLEIRWPNGTTQKLQNIAGDSIYTMTQGRGITDTMRLPASRE